MDFTSLRSLSPSIHEVDGGGMPGIDHAFCLRGYSNDIDNKVIRPVAKYFSFSLLINCRLIDEESGRCLEVATTECALIVYTSNWVNEKPPFVPVRERKWYYL